MRAATTNPMHVSPLVEQAKFETVKERNPEESKANGNSVLIEEQMQKIGDVKGPMNSPSICLPESLDVEDRHRQGRFVRLVSRS